MKADRSEQATPRDKAKTSRRSGRTRRVLLWIFAAVVLLLLATPGLLYVPQVQTFVKDKAMQWVNSDTARVQYSVGLIRIDFPFRLHVEDVMAVRDGRDTLFRIGALRTGLDDLPIGQRFFVVRHVEASDVSFRWPDLTPSLTIYGDVPGLTVNDVKLDPDGELQVGSLELPSPRIYVALRPAADDPEDDEPSTPWRVGVGQLSMSEARVGLDLDSVQLPRTMFDYNHLWLDSLNLDVAGIVYDGADDVIEADIRHLGVIDRRSGTRINSLVARFGMLGGHIGVSGLNLQMPDTHLAGDIVLDTGYFTASHTGCLTADLVAELGADDVVRQLSPYLPQAAAAWPSAPLRLKMDVDASGDTLRHMSALLDMTGRLNVTVEGDGFSLWDDSLRQASLQVSGRLDDADFLLTAFGDDAARRAWRLPAGLDVAVQAAQRQSLLSASVTVGHDNLQELEAHATLHTDDEGYQLVGNVAHFVPSDYMTSLPLALVSGRVSLSGRGFDLLQPRARLEGSLHVDTLAWWRRDGQGAHLADSLYGIGMQASLASHRYRLYVDSDHPHIDLDGTIDGLLRRDSLTAGGNIVLRRLDVSRLPSVGGTLGTFVFRAGFDAAYDWKDFAHLHLHVDSLAYDGTPLDDVTVDLHSAPDTLFAHLKGGDADILLDVNRSVDHIASVADSLVSELQRQLRRPTFDVEAMQHTLPHITLRLDMEQDNPFYPFLHYAGLGFSAAHVRLANAKRLSVRAHADDLITADGFSLDTLRLSVSPLPTEGYDYSLHAAYNDPKPKQSYSATIEGQLLCDSITVGLDYVNGLGLRLYQAGASLAIDSNAVLLRLAGHPVIYAQPFTVNADNYVRLELPEAEADGSRRLFGAGQGSLGLTAHLEMQGPQRLEALLLTTPVPERRGNRLVVACRHLDLDYLRRTVMWEHDAGGSLNMVFSALAVPDSLSGQLRLGVDDFHIGDWRADSLRLAAEVMQQVVNRSGHDPLQPAPAGWKPDFLTLGEGLLRIDTLQTLHLDYVQRDSLRLSAAVNALPLALLNTFMPTGMPLNGTAGGWLSMEGTSLSEARFDAAVSLRDAVWRYLDVGASISLPSDTLRMTDGRMAIDGYALRAAGKNPLMLSGWIDMSHDLANPKLSLRLQGDDVRLLDSRPPVVQPQYLCGRLPATVDVSVDGEVSALSVTGQVSLLSGTDLTYFMQDDAVALSGRADQLVEFVRFSQLDRKPSTLMLLPVAATGGAEVQLRLSIAGDAKVKVFLDSEGKDQANVMGGGQLKFGSDADGSISLAGTYDVQGGQISINLLPGSPIAVTKSFDLNDNSTVTFSGPVDEPEINMTASQEVRCSINDVSTGIRVVKFVVYVHLHGTLENLAVDFTCAAPEDAAMQTQLSSLTDEELTKQAMNLLIMQTYSGPGVTSGGSATANSLLNSYLQKGVESLMSQKLKHTQISVGIDQYDATGTGDTRTDYNVKISQGFFNDRMRVSVGGSMSSGSDEALGQRDNAVINDVSVEWMLNPDGTHYMRLFRKTNYESVLEGEVVEMGLGYVLHRQSFSFRSLLWSNEKRRRLIQQRIRSLEEKQPATPAAADTLNIRNTP